MLPISELYIGQSDAKHELDFETEDDFCAAFLLPPYIPLDLIKNGRKFLVRGARGVGKTTLLRWLSLQFRTEETPSHFILFKSEFSEEKKQELSNKVGISSQSYMSERFEVLQDFKALWRIILCAELCEFCLRNSQIVGDPTPLKKALQFLGLSNARSIFDKLASLLSGQKFYVMDLEGVQYGVEINLSDDNEKKPIAPDEVARIVEGIIGECDFLKPVRILLDELEVYRNSDHQYKRDLQMVRDLIFAVDHMNRIFRQSGQNISFIAAVRNEVLSAVGPLGEEVSKIVDDFGTEISWVDRKSNASHPLIGMLSHKLGLRYKERGEKFFVETIFPEKIFHSPWSKYLIDHSLARPRNVVNRLRIIQERFGNDFEFTLNSFELTQDQYSRMALAELENSLSAIYPDEASKAIIRALQGGRPLVTVDTFSERLRVLDRSGQKGVSHIFERGVSHVIENLFEFSAIGNSYKVQGKKFDLWSFRGERFPRMDKPFFVHQSLKRALSIQ